MNLLQTATWPLVEGASATSRWADVAMGLAAMTMVVVTSAVDTSPMSEGVDAPASRGASHSASRSERLAGSQFLNREKVASFYLAQPWYNRSDTKLHRNDGTDITLKNMGWDGDMLMPPIDGGVRYIDWFGPAGFMIDFLHNKAVARLGKGAHGRKLSKPVIETVETEGTLKGSPAPDKLKLTELFDRFEFTHGQNMLLFGGVLRFSGLSPRIRPYVGFGAGFAVPHVEVWFKGEKLENRTNEYQYAGPAASAIAGIEFRFGRLSYFLEYKSSWASISGDLTGDESWKNFNLPGDLLRQVRRWWKDEEPVYGDFSTTLTAHQAVGGIGWRLTPSPALAP
ncbi:MAG TPA: lipid A oxidase [Hyphomicrobiaceae bacterium]|nr:lipid A oxidase [Hyphomicrobiaceae bacterium]